MPIVLQPIDQVAKVQLAQQLACWAKMANGMTDRAVQFGTCCASPTGETIGRWTIPDGLCDTYGALPFTGNNGQTIVCPPTQAEIMPYYIYDDDVAATDPNTCIAQEALAVPTNFAAGTPTTTEVPLSWDAVANADGYAIEYSSDGGATWQTPVVVGNVTSTTLTGLTASTEYTIRIRATDATGQYNSSDWSAAITATTTA